MDNSPSNVHVPGIINKRTFGVFIASLVIALVLSSCGGSTSGGVTAPFGSTITIDPTAYSVGDAGTSITVHTEYFTIQVLGPDGTPFNKALITIEFPWSPPDPTSLVQLYDGNVPQSSPFSAVTNEFGLYTLRVDYESGGGLLYHGNITVRTGSASATSTLTITNTAS